MAAFWTVLALIMVALSAISITEARGVCLGMKGDNLPSVSDMVSLYKSNNINMIRLYEPNHSVLEALRGDLTSSTNHGFVFLVTLGCRNDDIPKLASSLVAAQTWFSTHVEPYLNNMVIQFITIGNELIPGEYSQYIAPAIQNIRTIIDQKGLMDTMVTTVISSNALGSSYPPSSGAFSDEAKVAMHNVLQLLNEHNTPLMINVYPYFAYAAEPVYISLEYALFNATSPVVRDGDLEYYNLFDAMVDAFYSAMEREGSDVGVIISETGWPSYGNGNFTTPELAGTYNRRFVEHITNFGTPKWPEFPLALYFVFSMFEENLKPAGVEQHFGLYHTNMEPVYPNIFTP